MNAKPTKQRNPHMANKANDGASAVSDLGAILPASEQATTYNRSPADIDAISAAILGLDRDARELERKWGVGRLLILADDLLRERFRRQLRRLNELIRGDAPAHEVRPHVEATRRGWLALEKAALAAGHRPSLPEVWEVALQDGTVAAIVRTSAEASQVAASGRRVAVYTLEEIATLLNRHPLLVAAKETFPGAAVTGFATKLERPPDDGFDWERGDEIPW